MLPGHATPEGTVRYRDRFPKLRAAGHFRPVLAEKLWIASIGLGTYLGEPDERTDNAYEEAATTALRSGVNLLDTAINYRHQRSERNLGAALEKVVVAGELSRDEVVVCSKAGYLAFDGDLPPDPRGYFQREYIDRGVLNPAEVAGGMHCMAPEYLADQIERSRRNLRLETLDVFYLHNPETQLADVDRAKFFERLRRAFAMLELAAAENKIVHYGMATWNGFRVSPDGREYLDLAEIIGAARTAGGENHRFRFIQLPFNLALPEAFTLRNQRGPNGALSALELAAREGINVIGSAAIFQGRLAQDLPPDLGQKLGTATDSATAIQFARSAPGVAAALIGMSRVEHVRENLRVAEQPPAEEAQWLSLFRQS